MQQVTEEYNNKSLARLNKQAWTRAGVAVNAGSASEAAKQAGLDWTVSNKPLFAEIEPASIDMHGVSQALYKQVTNRNAMVRNDTNEVIGVVGDKYKIVQNMEVFSALDTLVDSGDARYTAAGEYNNGANIWMVMELPIGVNVANDPHAAFLLVQSSHDGSCAVRIRPIIERLFCSNQINKLIKGKKTNDFTYVMKHTTNSELSVQDIRNITQLTYQAIEEYEVTASGLLKREVSTAQVRDYFKRVWALPSTVEDKPYHLLTQGERRQQTIAITARDKAWQVYNESETQANIRGTAFGAWQAVVEYADHHASGGSERLAVAALSGRSDGIKSKALELVLA
jgi:phage/plasmid-like protein (TIGR03299 family)